VNCRKYVGKMPSFIDGCARFLLSNFLGGIAKAKSHKAPAKRVCFWPLDKYSNFSSAEISLSTSGLTQIPEEGKKEESKGIVLIGTY
jgi:hypothetical protein